MTGASKLKRTALLCSTNSSKSTLMRLCYLRMGMGGYCKLGSRLGGTKVLVGSARRTAKLRNQEPPLPLEAAPQASLTVHPPLGLRHRAALPLDSIPRAC